MDEKEVILWTQYKKSGDSRLQETLVQKYLPLVRFVVSRLMVRLPQHFEYDDLVEDGVIGLLEALERFDLNRNIKFETFAQLRIRGAILDQLREQDVFSRTDRKKLKALEEACEGLEAELGRSATDEEIAKKMGITTVVYQKLLSDVAPLTFLSLDESRDEEGTGHLRDVLEDEQSPNPEILSEKQELKNMMVQILQALSDQERNVVALYYYEELTLKEISRVLSVSESRVCQIHGQAMLKLRGKLKKELYG